MYAKWHYNASPSSFILPTESAQTHTNIMCGKTDNTGNGGDKAFAASDQAQEYVAPFTPWTDGEPLKPNRYGMIPDRTTSR